MAGTCLLVFATYLAAKYSFYRQNEDVLVKRDIMVCLGLQ